MVKATVYRYINCFLSNCFVVRQWYHFFIELTQEMARLNNMLADRTSQMDYDFNLGRPKYKLQGYI